MNPDRLVKKRFIYNFLNFLGDIGGLQRSLTKIASFTLSLLGYGGALAGHLVGSVFVTPGPNEHAGSLAIDFRRKLTKSDMLYAKEIVN